MPHAIIHGRRIHYEEQGPNSAGSITPPAGVVFLNGLSGDGLYWKSQLRGFGRRRRCLALDNRDVGQSDPAAEPYSTADLADDLAGLLDHLRFGTVHLVGLSMGGMIAQEAALRRPDLVRSLVLVDTLASADGWFLSLADSFEAIRRRSADTPAFFEAILAWWVGSRFLDDPERGTWLRWLLRQSPHPQPLEGFLRQLEAMRRHAALDRMASLSCPTLVLVGEEDAIMPVRYSRQMAARIAQAELQIVPGCGHALPLELGRDFDRRVAEFVAKVDEQAFAAENG